MKLAIIGSRSIANDAWVLKIVDKIVKELKPSSILMGSARGPDNAVSHYAKSHDIDIIRFLPYHLVDPIANFNSKYFFIRTKQIVNNADHVLALWDTKSNGTQYGIRYAQKLDIPVTVIKYYESPNTFAYS